MRNICNVIMKCLWVVSIVFTIFGGLYALEGESRADNIMQQIFYMSAAIASAVIPYCICRAIQMILLHGDAIEK